MPIAEELEARARAMDRSALQKFWDQLVRGPVPKWGPGKALEYFVVRAFELEGAEVTYPFSVRLALTGGASAEMEQLDGVVRVEGLWCLCEAKDTAAPQSVESIAKLRNQLQRRPAGCVGIVVSPHGFTDAAKLATNFMGDQAILLWTGTDVDWALKHGFGKALVRKYRFAVEYGLRDYVLTEEDQ